jgi:hypothetical protein
LLQQQPATVLDGADLKFEIHQLGLSDILGRADVLCAAEQIRVMLANFKISTDQLCPISYQDLANAQRFFQQDLDGYPQLNRYRIVDGLWVCRPDQAKTSE